MVYKCQNCGGNMVYSPSRKKMYCPYCSAEETQAEEKGESLKVCANCGGELDGVKEYTSATKCPYCGCYIVLEERIEGQYTPELIVPFQMEKDAAVEKLRKEFGSRVFTPDSFLTESTLEDLQGVYVPFWMYDFDTNYDYEGEGTKVDVHVSGDVEITETSYYNIVRNMDIDFRRIPVDASIEMEDGVMDLLEPFDYGQLESFVPKYMSGFYAERYNEGADSLEKRARVRVEKDAGDMLDSTITGYNTVSARRKNLNMRRAAADYALLPVWRYTYKYKDKDYVYHINGQTGKVIGKTPVAVGKVFGYGATAGVLASLACTFIMGIMGVL